VLHDLASQMHAILNGDLMNNLQELRALTSLLGDLCEFFGFIEPRAASSPDIADDIAPAALMSVVQRCRDLIDAKPFDEGKRAIDSAVSDEESLATAAVLDLLGELRALARSKKRYDIADAIRDGLRDAGYVVEDRMGATSIRAES
jgi:cysteinyl-tRNA synthetase